MRFKIGDKVCVCSKYDGIIETAIKSVVYESDLPGFSQYELEDNILIDLYNGIGSSCVEIEEQWHGLTEMYRPACEYELFVIGDTIRIQTVLTEHYINRNY